jgi:hypothetical protein
MKKKYVGLSATALICVWTFSGASTSFADPFPDPPQKPVAVATFWCGAGNTSCEITCVAGNTERKFTGLNSARVQTYPGSNKLWLETSLGPNSIILLGDALCDFSKMPISRPLN